MSVLQKTSSVIFSEALESYLCCKVCSIFSHHRFYLNQVFCRQFSWEYFNRFLQNCCGCCASVWTCPSAEKACPGSWDATEISVNDGQVDVRGGSRARDVKKRDQRPSDRVWVTEKYLHWHAKFSFLPSLTPATQGFPLFFKTHRPTYIRLKSAVWLINKFTGIGGKMEGGHDPPLVFSLHLRMDNKSWTEELRVLRGINPLHASDWLVDEWHI